MANTIVLARYQTWQKRKEGAIQVVSVSLDATESDELDQ
jgi:hypothetical protein